MKDLIARISPGRPVLIAGPTGSGKSALALGIAEAQGGVIVNADALQVYGCWRVLSARPTPEDEARAPHRLYGHVGRDQPYSVGHWLREVRGVLDSGARPIITGGTGLYFMALTEGLTEIPAIPLDIRAEADALRLGGRMDRMCADLDPETLARIDAQNPARVQRAWEVWRSTGQSLASWQSRTGPALLPRAAAEALVLRPEVGWLNARIDARFDAMVAGGALDEVADELPHWQPDRPSARAIGAPELVAHLRGETTLADAITAGQLASRQYAKRQRTWFRNRMADWQSVALP